MTLRNTALWFGAINLALGLAALVGPLVGGNDQPINLDSGDLFGFLAVNWAHALLHVAFGLYGLASRRSTGAAIGHFRAVAVVFGLVALLGWLGEAGALVRKDAEGTLLALQVAVDTPGNLLHTAFLAVGVWWGWLRPRDRAAAHARPGAAAILAMAVGGVLAVGLLLVPVENLKVAPWAHHGSEGRSHFQMKNATRLAGDAAEVRRAVARALAFDGSAVPGPSPDWREEVARSSGWAPAPRHVVALAGGGDGAERWALPGAYWAAFAGVPVVLVGRDGLGAEAAEEVVRHGLPVYLLAPRHLAADAVLAELREAGPAVRVAGASLAEHGVRIAEYRDEETGFGWGRDHEQLATWFSYVVAAPEDAPQAWAALPLARPVAATFLFAGDGGGIPAATDRYVWSQRADWFVTPSETSFRHFWVVGDRVSYGAQARLDLAVEKAAYLSKGSVALGPLEGLGLVFIALGVAGFIFVLLHRARLLPEVGASMAAAWAFTALLLPVAGVILYLAAYRRPRLNPDGEMPRWLRPPAIQAAAGTAMGFGFGAPLMIAIGYVFVYYGFPLFFGEWAQGWPFLFGAGMPLMMLGMYVGAVLLAWPFVQTGMQSMMHGASGREVVWRALGVTSISMAAVSLGMMSMSWWMMMERHPMMMPHEDELLWFFSMWLASAVGFLVAWPLNGPMVRGGLKMGSM